MALFIRKYNEIFKLIGISLIIFLNSCSSSDKTKIRVACAANLEYTVQAIAEEFEKDCECEVEIITASTGQLTNQIVQGAPFDVFLSASMKYDDLLREKDLVEGKLNIFAEARLILWSMKDLKLNEDYLRTGDFNTIAIPNPTVAPIGEGAMDFLGSQGHLNHLRGRIVYGGSVSQVNQMIASNHVDLGITSMSALYNPNLNKEGSWYEIGPLKHGAIFQTAVVLKNSPNIELAKEFSEFLNTETAKEILIQHGYDMPISTSFK